MAIDLGLLFVCVVISFVLVVVVSLICEFLFRVLVELVLLVYAIGIYVFVFSYVFIVFCVLYSYWDIVLRCTVYAYAFAFITW